MGRHRQRQILRNLSAHINLKENEKCQESQFGAKKRKIRFSLFWPPDCPLRGIPVISSFCWPLAFTLASTISLFFSLHAGPQKTESVSDDNGPAYEGKETKKWKGTYSVRLEAQSRSDHNSIVTAPHLTDLFPLH